MLHVTQVFGYNIIANHSSTISTSFFLMILVIALIITQKIAISRHVVPTIWLIQEGINLIQKEVTTLEEARYSFDRLHKNNTQSLFGSQFSSSSNSHVSIVSCHSLMKLSNASYWPTIHGEGEIALCLQINTKHQQLGSWDLISLVHCFPYC